MSREHTFHSPRPKELGKITKADLNDMASLSQELGTKYANGSYIVTPAYIGCEINPDGDISVITGTSYDDSDGTIYYNSNVTTPLNAKEITLVGDAVKPFVAATQEWLHPDETIVMGYCTMPLEPSLPGGWHTDGNPSTDDFRGVLFYDALPTEFAVGSVPLETPDDQPITPRTIDAHLTIRRVRQALFDKELTLTEGPEPLRAVGFANEHLHQVAPVTRELDGVTRKFLRLTTRRTQ
jgi:hypothetical protein